MLIDLVNRLRQHSGLPVAAPQTAHLTFVDAIQAAKKGASATSLNEAVADIIACLQWLNSYQQGDADARNQILSLDVVYAISGVTLLALEAMIFLHKSGRNCGDLLTASWKINCAWDAVLAGDIDDIPEHIEYESTARNLDAV